MAIVDETGVAIRADFTQFDGDVDKGAKSASAEFAKSFNPGPARDAAGRFLPSNKDGAESGQKTGKGFTSGLSNTLHSGISGLAGPVKGLLRNLAIGAAAVFTVEGVTDFFKSSDERAVESNKLGAITAQTIKATGGAAHETSGQVNELADSIARKTGVDEEQIHSSENTLLAFTNVRNEVGKGNDVFNRATSLVNDLSVATGRGAKTSALALGKALQDPAKQLTALTRVGVIFTAGQKAQIASMVKNHDTLGAQKLILQQLQDRYGGVAAAASTTSGKFKVAVEGIQNTIGKALVPVINLAAGGLITLTSVLDSPAFAAFAAKVTAGLSLAVNAVRLFVGSFTGAGSSADIYNSLTNPIITLGSEARAVFDGVLVPAFHDLVKIVTGSIVPAVRNLVTLFAPLAEQIAGTVGPVVIAAFAELASVLTNQIAPALVTVTGFLDQHAVAVRAVAVALLAGVAAYKAIALAKTIISGIANITKIWAAAQAALNAVMDTNPIILVVVGLAALAAGLIYAYKNSQTFRTVVTEVLSAVETAFHAVVGVAETVLSFIGGHWKLIGALLIGPIGLVVLFIATHFSQIVGIINGALSAIGSVMEKIATVLTFPIRLALAILLAIVFAGFNALSGPISAALGFIRSIISTAFGFYVTIVRTEMAILSTVVRAVWGAIVAVVTAVLGVLRAVVSREWHGLVAVVSAVAGALSAAARAVFNRVKDAVTSVLSTLGGLVSKPFRAVVSTVGGFGDKLFTAATTVFGRIKDAATSVVGDMASIGGDIVHGIINGITGLGSTLTHDITKFIDDNVPKPVRKLLGIASPSKVFTEIGSQIPAGLALGINSGRGDVARSVTSMLGTAHAPNALAVGSSSSAVSSGGSRTASNTGAGGPALVIEHYHAAAASNPYAEASNLALIARSRGGSIGPSK